MRSIEKIKVDIARLKPSEVRQIAEWLAGYESGLWDKQIWEDAAAGMLDHFIEEALEEYAHGRTRPLA